MFDKEDGNFIRVKWDEAIFKEISEFEMLIFQKKELRHKESLVVGGNMIDTSMYNT